MKLSEFHYELPKDLIAQKPSEKREMSKLLLLDKTSGAINHDIFKNISSYLNNGDCLVLNDTKVIPARLNGKRKDTLGAMEFVLLKDHGDDVWEVLVRPGKRAIPGNDFVFGENNELEAEVIEILFDGNRLVKFKYQGIFLEIIEKIGVMPLPPYIKTKLKDKERYQTIYAKDPGSAAAPTAGLHFTKELLKEIEKKGINIVYITLHIGLGTFRPVKTKDIKDHKMHTESFSISKETCEVINNTRKNNKRVIAVGTTCARVLESAASEESILFPMNGETDIFIYPGYKYKIVNELITNFHLPESTLLMLVSALASKEYIIDAYETAIKEKYRFFSFGDAMFIYNGKDKNGADQV